MQNTIEIERHAVLLAEGHECLTSMEHRLLITFLRHPGEVLSRETLLSEVWGYSFPGGTRTVDVHVKELRRKLALNDRIETVYKVGYRFAL